MVIMSPRPGVIPLPKCFLWLIDGVPKYLLTGMILQESGTLISMILPRQGRRLTPCLAFRDEGAYRVTRVGFLF